MNLEKYKDLSLQELDKLKDNFDVIVKWVAWIVKTTDWDLLLVLENENKAWKKKWQWSIPMETIEEGETSWQALLRWLKEELNLGLSSKMKVWPEDLLIPFVVFDSKKHKLILVELEIYSVLLESDKIRNLLNFSSWEINKIKSVSLRDYLSMKNLRPGNKEIFEGINKSTVIIDWEYLN